MMIVPILLVAVMQTPSADLEKIGINTIPIESESITWQCDLVTQFDSKFKVSGVLMELKGTDTAKMGDRLGEAFISSNSAMVYPGKYEVYFKDVSEFSLFSKSDNGTTHMIDLNLPAQKKSVGSAVFLERKGASGGHLFTTTGVGFCASQTTYDFGEGK